MRALGIEIRRSAPPLKAAGTAFELRSMQTAVASTQVPAVQAAAPRLPDRRQPFDKGLVDVQPPFGTNPPRGPVSVTGDGNLADRLVHNDPRELWYLNLPQKLTPKQVLQILRSALGGDLWQQWQLCSLMLDTWPMLRKCSHELREPASNAEFQVHPYNPDGGEASKSALEKAALVRRAMSNFNPDPFSDEKGWVGMLYDATDAMLNGLTMVEMIWDKPKDDGFGMERLPKSAAWVHPRHYTFTNDGKVAVFDQDYNRLTYRLAGSGSGYPAPDYRKFLCAQFLSRSGSSLGAGLIRPLAWDWAAVMFGREWMLKAAQNHGAPFVDATYKPGIRDDDLNRLDQEIANGLANRFIRHVEGTTINVEPAQSLGSDNPQRHLMELADQHCAFLLLGQESTTQSQPGKLGGGDDSKSEVRRERVQGLVKWLSSEVLPQFARAVLAANYGVDNVSEVPAIKPDFTGEMDPTAQADRDTKILSTGAPMKADDFYKNNRLEQPQPGDLIIQRGVLGVMADPTAPPEPGEEPGAGDPDGDEQDATAKAVNVVSFNLSKVLAKATPQELGELLPLVAAAESAPHANGELKLLHGKINSIARSHRI